MCRSRLKDHNPVAGRVHFRADRIAKPAHSARDYCNAHECPPCLIAEVNEFSGVMSQTLSPTTVASQSRAILSKPSSEFLREMVHFLELSRVKSVWLCKSAMVSPRSCPHPGRALARARSLIRKPILRDGNLPIWPATDSQRFAWIVPSHSKQGLPIHGCIHVASSTK